MIITLIKTIASGEISVNNLMEAGLEGLIGDYKYIIQNANVLNPFTDVTDEQVYKIGNHLSGVVTDLILTATGTSAAKLIKVLLNTKSGAKVVKVKNRLVKEQDGLKISKKYHDYKGTGDFLKAGSKAEALKAIDKLPSSVQRVVKSFFKGASSKYTDFFVERTSKGNYIVRMTKPGDVPGSKAIYYKEIASDGSTIRV